MEDFVAKVTNTRMKNFALIILLAFVFFNTRAQVKVRGIVTEANTDPTVKSVKKPLAGVQIQAMGAVAPEVTDSSGYFTLVFQGKKPGDLIRVLFVQKSGYEVFNSDILDNWKVSNDPNWIEKIKMCPAGTIDRLKAHNFESLNNTLLAQYEKQKEDLKKLKISDADLNEKYRSLDEKFQSQHKQLAEYVERFVHIDFDEVSNLYRKAYSQFLKGNLDSVAVILKKVDFESRVKKIPGEQSNIQNAIKEDMKEDIEALKILAQTYVMKFDYGKATPLYEQLVMLDSTNLVMGHMEEVYGNLARCYLLNKQYTKSDSSAHAAIEIARKNNIEESQYNWVYINLAPSLLFQGKFEEAKKIYLEWKDQVYPSDTDKTFRFFFLKCLDDLKQAGVTHPDVKKNKGTT
jgi:tetratricopeptide (TPR) repeat protein